MYQSRIQNKKRGSRNQKNREIEDLEDGQEYALVREMMGNGRLRVLMPDGELKMARIPGSMRKYKRKCLIERGDLVVVSTRDFEPSKADVLHKYTFDEAMMLLNRGFLPPNIARAYNQQEWMNANRDGDE